MSKYDKNHPLAIMSRDRVPLILDTISSDDLINLVKRTPSCRGVLAGTIAELKFLEYVKRNKAFSDFYKPDDHNRAENKIDLRVSYKGHFITFQLKSIQTNSIKWDVSANRLVCDVRNDGSDKRPVTLPNGETIETTNYKFGDYDILVVPLFPFTGEWDFAFLLNSDCTPTSSPRYSTSISKYLIKTIERLTFPISEKWTCNIMDAINRLFESKGITL